MTTPPWVTVYGRGGFPEYDGPDRRARDRSAPPKWAAREIAAVFATKPADTLTTLPPASVEPEASA